MVFDLAKSESLLKPEEKEVSEEEIEYIYSLLVDPELQNELKTLLQNYSMLVRARKGESIEPEDIFSGMLNIKDIRERTRFPSYLDLRRHIYLRFLSLIVPEASDLFKAWADEEGHEFISYPKGEGRKEGVEIMKAKGMIMQGIAPIFLGEQRVAEKPKGRFQQLKEKISPRSEE